LVLTAGQVSYVGQEDNHLPTLTVQETLEFAGQCLIDWDSIDHAFEEYVRSHPQEAEEELQILKKAVGNAKFLPPIVPPLHLSIYLSAHPSIYLFIFQCIYVLH
tara:strand:+ start:1373 stop:1684 length:312 start_codon:yes stop_codon:yes gene_type:complete